MIGLTQPEVAVIHFDHTHAVEPIDRPHGLEAVEVPETFPSGL